MGVSTGKNRGFLSMNGERGWGSLGGVLGRLGAVFGPSWAVLGRLGGALGRLGGVLETSWGPLGAVLGRLGVFLTLHKWVFRLVKIVVF